VWDAPPLQRGRLIEQQLGHNLPDNFPTIDRFQDGVATSIKSMDLTTPSYANAEKITGMGRGYVDSVADFQGKKWGGVDIKPRDITARGLDLAVPAGATAAQQQALQSLITYGAQNGVTVRIVVVP
jgi:filamentous hemagglutinin